MEDAKKARTISARLVTRRINELLNGIKIASGKEEINEKINNVKSVVEELGRAQDEVIGVADEGDVENENKWYDEYDLKANLAIKEGRRYVSQTDVANRPHDKQNVRFKRLEIPKFHSNPKDFFKWKETFERFTADFDDHSKYDYLFTSTVGESHNYVQNKSNYKDAIEKLEEKYGNIHFIMGLLIDDIKSLPVVRKGDFRNFENLTFHVNDFHDRLTVMGRQDDAENSYILKEIEAKLNSDDIQRWLESRGDDVDNRKVGDLVKWLDKQTHLRRITFHNISRSSLGSPFERKVGAASVGFAGKQEQWTRCPVCSSEHTIAECPTFQSLNLKERWDRVKLSRVFFLCLCRGHRRQECSEPFCSICSGPHHMLLHNYAASNYDPNRPFITNEVVQSSTGDINAIGAMSGERNLSRSFLPIVQVTLKNNRHEFVTTAVLDSGSELNVMTTKCYERLKLKGKTIDINIVGAGGVTSRTRTKMVNVFVKDIFGAETYVECIVLNRACGRALPISPECINDAKMLPNFDPSALIAGGGEIDFLVGMSSPDLHKQYALEKLPNGLCLMKTRFGPCLVGAAPRMFTGNYECGAYNVNDLHILDATPSEENLWQHLQSELAGINREIEMPGKTDDEVLFDTKMRSAWTTDANGRFEVKLPWKIDPETLENNREQAKNRDAKLRKQLEKKRDVHELFNQQINEMIENGIIRMVDPGYPRRYLPLLAVVNLNKESSKVRICLDARCKFNGISLNDALLKGRVEMVDIFRALTQFRSGKFAITGDIKKMFWQIKLSAEDQKYHGLIWNGETYVFTRVSFGGKPSPPIADYSMMKVAEIGKKMLPLGAEVIRNNRYVDDILVASSSMRDILRRRNETQALLGKFGFDIKLWRSNHPNIGQVDKDCKVLGVQWDAKLDVLSPTVKFENSEDFEFTRRNVLSKIAEVWDPLGICSGLLVLGKLILQSIVRMKKNWDEPIDDDELLQRWQRWQAESRKCNELIVSRSLLPTVEFPEKPKCSLIGYSDGSSVGYGCALYLRWFNEDETIIDVTFVGAKGKLNPIKGTTVPRSEIGGAFILSRLAYSARKSFSGTEIDDLLQEEVLFTDSTTVLSWIRSAAIKYKPFVKNKIVEIQELHPIKVWKYVPSTHNKAADLISKGCLFKDLRNIIKGPEMLRTPRCVWPAAPLVKDKLEINSEKTPSVLVNAATAETLPIEVEKFSSWKRLVRVTALVFRFILGRSGTADVVNRENELFHITEIEEKRAEKYWILEAQKLIEVPSKQTEKLCPFKDEDGIIRISGRLKNSVLFDENRKHPILLPKNHKTSVLITHQAHDDLYHPGHQRVIAEVRKKYWVIGLRTIAKNIGKNCVICRRWRNNSLEQIMVDLPLFRVTPGKPFESSAVDYFGPFQVKYGRRQRTKAYGAVFTCLTTRAIHLELVTDLSTDRFLQALRRFISLYGQPKLLRSDNGRNFVGAARELRMMLKRWKEEKEENSRIVEFCATRSIRWIFSTPLASHHNGAVETMVKSVKSTLNKIVKDRILTEEEYRTVLAEVTACINSRPLWPANDGDVDTPPITCVDLLRPAGLPRDPETMNLNCNPRKRYQYIQLLVNEWWSLWMQNFVPNLQVRSKWFKKRENIAVGDIVLLIDKETCRSKWRMAVVEKVYPGNDGLVRSVRVKTSTGNYDRPITKLTLLLSKEEQSNGSNL